MKISGLQQFKEKTRANMPVWQLKMLQTFGLLWSAVW